MNPLAENEQDSETTRVLIVDDSSMTRWLMGQIMEADPFLEVVATASDALEARRLIKSLNPDVITLDIEMPGMNGIEFLSHMMRLRPMPVVMVSSLTARSAEFTLKALSLGAVDVVSKPQAALSPGELATYSAELTAKVRMASKAHVRPLPAESTDILVRQPDKKPTPVSVADGEASHQVLAIGASTGGTEAICQTLSSLPEDSPGVVIVQHISDPFNQAFVNRLNTLTPLHVRQATEGALICRGHAYVAPPGHHLTINKDRSRYTCQLQQDAPMNFHRPSVDVLFESVARHAGGDAIGVIMTGMGRDGAHGLAAMRAAGAHTIAQDQRSSVVWGMPGAAIDLGAASEVVPLGKIAERIVACL